MPHHRGLQAARRAVAPPWRLALCRGIRRRYPEWKYLLDGDGGDENLKDYPIEDNPELTIRSVLNNPLLYQEGWGVAAIKHSLTYSGGQSRGYARTYAPLAQTGFVGLSPFVCPSVIAVAEGIPFIELTGWDHERLYELKGQVAALACGRSPDWTCRIFPKRRSGAEPATAPHGSFLPAAANIAGFSRESMRISTMGRRSRTP